jgi:hypothetical protein
MLETGFGFAPDGIGTTECMYSSTANWEEHSRERQLWCAVIFRAVQDATQSLEGTELTPERQRQRDEARRWFAENGRDYEYACESAGLDAEFVRARVLKYADDAGAFARSEREVAPSGRFDVSSAPSTLR